MNPIFILSAFLALASAQTFHWEKLPLHMKVLGCIELSPSKTEAAKCVAANIGADVGAAKDKVEELLKTADQKVKDFLSEIFGKREKRDATIAQVWDQVPLLTKVQICMASESKTEAAKCVAANLGADLVAAKNKVEELLKTGGQDVKDFLKANGAMIHGYLESIGGVVDQVHDKAHELKEKAKEWFNEKFGKREKRQNYGAMWEAMPLYAKVQGCIELSPSKTEAAKCIKANIGASAGAAKDKVEELLKTADQKVKDFLHEIFGKRQKRQNYGAMWEAMPLYAKVQGCIELSPSKTEAAKCVAANIGHDAVAAKDKVEELLKTASQKVKDFLKEHFGK